MKLESASCHFAGLKDQYSRFTECTARSSLVQRKLLVRPNEEAHTTDQSTICFDRHAQTACPSRHVAVSHSSGPADYTSSQTRGIHSDVLHGTFSHKHRRISIHISSPLRVCTRPAA